MARSNSTVLGTAKTLTNVSQRLAFLIGIGIAVAIYVAAYPLKDFPGIPVYEFLFNRGWFQYVSTLAFGYAVGIMWLKTDRIRAEKAAFNIVDQKVFGALAGQSAISADQTLVVKQAIEKLEPAVQRTMLATRLENASRRLVNTRSAAEVDNIFQILSDGDANIVASSYTTVRFLIALIPLLGFLGNVYGVGQGIGAFSEVLSQAQSFDSVRPALQFAAFSLAIAFDVTFLALFYSGLLLFLHASVQQREENLLAAVDEYCIDRFISRIHIVSADIAELRDTMTNLASDGLEIIDGGLKQIVKSIEKSSPTDGSAAVVKELKTLGKGVGESQTLIISTLQENAKTVRSMVDGLGKLLISRDNGAESLAELKETALSIAHILEENVVGMKDRLVALEGQHEAPGVSLDAVVKSLETIARQMSTLETVGEGFRAAASMTAMLGDLQQTLDALKPAIESMSSEMAKEVNKILGQLLRVMVVANRADRWRDEELRVLTDPELLRRIFSQAV